MIASNARLHPFCDDCPHRTSDSVNCGSLVICWDECEYAAKGPDDEVCPKHEAYLKEKTEEDDGDE